MQVEINSGSGQMDMGDNIESDWCSFGLYICIFPDYNIILYYFI
jgi:hypothetical protein